MLIGSALKWSLCIPGIDNSMWNGLDLFLITSADFHLHLYAALHSVEANMGFYTVRSPMYFGNSSFDT